MTDLKKFTKEWVVPVIMAIIIAMLINRYILFKIYIPSESMVPTLGIGDQLFVTRVYNKDRIKRGDMLVFYSHELEDLLIKRVIGLPGEEIELKGDGAVFVNGEKLEEPYVVNKSNKSGKFLVPEGKFFFLGDNRANSRDSRVWEEPYISKNDVRGKAQVIVFPFKRFGFIK